MISHMEKRIQKRTEEQKAERRAEYQRCKTLSLCLNCRKPAWREGATLCQEHRVAGRLSAEKSREKRKSLGLCFRCDEPICDYHSALCDKHAQASNLRKSQNRAERIAKGLCRNCGSEKPDGRVHCQACSDYAAKFQKEHKSKIFNHYGRKCACCGITEEVFLTIDHINEDGSKHRKSLGNAGVYKDIVDRNFPSDFQILCWNCNLAKHKLGKCPHQTK